MACAPKSAAEAAATHGVLARARHRRRRSSPGPGQAAARPAGGGARRRATGCCATHAAGAASCTCWSRHHADDQAETVAMRAGPPERARRAGRHGGPGRASEVRLLRPLLGVPRARLTATLLARGVAGSTIPRTSIRASSGRGCGQDGARFRAVDGSRRPRRTVGARRHWLGRAGDAWSFEQDGAVGPRSDRLLSRIGPRNLQAGC